MSSSPSSSSAAAILFCLPSVACVLLIIVQSQLYKSKKRNWKILLSKIYNALFQTALIVGLIFSIVSPGANYLGDNIITTLTGAGFQILVFLLIHCSIEILACFALFDENISPKRLKLYARIFTVVMIPVIFFNGYRSVFYLIGDLQTFTNLRFAIYGVNLTVNISAAICDCILNLYLLRKLQAFCSDRSKDVTLEFLKTGFLIKLCLGLDFLASIAFILEVVLPLSLLNADGILAFVCGTLGLQFVSQTLIIQRMVKHVSGLSTDKNVEVFSVSMDKDTKGPLLSQ